MRIPTEALKELRDEENTNELRIPHGMIATTVPLLEGIAEIELRALLSRVARAAYKQGRQHKLYEIQKALADT